MGYTVKHGMSDWGDKAHVKSHSRAKRKPVDKWDEPKPGEPADAAMPPKGFIPFGKKRKGK